MGLDGSLLALQASIEVQAWDKTAAGAKEVEAAIVAAVALAPAQTGAVVLATSDIFDEERDLDGRLVSIEWWG